MNVRPAAQQFWQDPIAVSMARDVELVLEAYGGTVEVAKLYAFGFKTDHPIWLRVLDYLKSTHGWRFAHTDERLSLRK